MYDFLIVGQGIAGSLLAYRLLKSGKKVIIVDNSPAPALAKMTQNIITSKYPRPLLKFSDYLYPKLKQLLGENFKPKVIGGLITPVTGKRFTKTWLVDTLIPTAETFYRDRENEFNTSFYQSVPVVRIFADAKQANDWDVRRADASYDKLVFEDYSFRNNYIHHPHGYTVFRQGAVVDGAKMLFKFYDYFKKSGCIENHTFSADTLIVKNDAVEWNTITARCLIFCDGWLAVNNPYFNWLPFLPAKGELLIIKSAFLKLKEVINRGVYIRPLGHDLYLTGSTYTWHDLSPEPTIQAREEISAKLKTFLKTEFSIIEQLAGIRPTVKGRRPFIGRHPQHKNIYTFNGLGTKGLLLAPFFSGHLCEHLLHGSPLLSEVDIKRFYKG